MMCTQVFAVVLATLLLQVPPQDQRRSLLAQLPEHTEIHGWSRTDTARIYEGRELFRYIDGGADLFFEYGFRQVLAAEYSNAGGGQITLEIYEMNDPGAAFGIFSIRSGEEAAPINIGEDGSAHAYYLMFWKGRFHVTLAASDSTVECRGGLESIARAIDHNLSKEGRRSNLVHFLPKRNLLKQRYFRGPLGLSSARTLDVNGIFPILDGAVGTYDDHTTILLRYVSAIEAGEHLAAIDSSLRSDERYTGYQHRDQVRRIADKRNQSIYLGQSGSFIIVSISPNETIAGDSCRKAIALLRKKRGI
jgi:hypothetical protein